MSEPGFVNAEFYARAVSELVLPCVDVAVSTPAGVPLVLRKNEPAKGKWWFPGGRVRFGESMAAAACRKLFEEVGIMCHGALMQQWKAFDMIWPVSAQGGPTQLVSIVFFAELDSVPVLKTDEHHSDVKFFRDFREAEPFVKTTVFELTNWDKRLRSLVRMQ